MNRTSLRAAMMIETFVTDSDNGFDKESLGLDKEAFPRENHPKVKRIINCKESVNRSFESGLSDGILT